MKMEVSLILALDTIKPLSQIDSHTARVMIVQWLGIFGFDAMDKVDIYMSIFENRDNLNRLIKRIEGPAEISDQSKK